MIESYNNSIQSKANLQPSELRCVLDKLSTKIVNDFIPADASTVLPSSKPGNTHDAANPNIVSSYKVILEKTETGSVKEVEELSEC